MYPIQGNLIHTYYAIKKSYINHTNLFYNKNKPLTICKSIFCIFHSKIKALVSF